MSSLVQAIARLLRQSPHPVAARVLAERFLKVECDEDTGRRLLDPALGSVPGAVYREGQGWTLAGPAPPGAEGFWEDFVAACAAPAVGRTGARIRLAWVHFSARQPVAVRGPDSAARLALPPAGCPVVAEGPPAELRAIRAWLARSATAGPLIDLGRLRRVVEGRTRRRREIQAEDSGADLVERARMAGRGLLAMAAELAAAGLGDPGRALAAGRSPGSLAAPGFDRALLRRLPLGPGIYRFLDASGEAYYVGKARSLRRRVRSYFTAAAQRSARVRRLLSRLSRVEVEPLATEADSLLEEHSAILRERPCGNVQVSLGQAGEGALARGRWGVVAPPAGPRGTCSVFFLVEGRLACRMRKVAGSQRRRLARALSRTRRVPSSRRAHEGGVQLQRWLARRPQEFSLVDLDAGAGQQDALRRLADLLRHYEKDRERVEVR